MTKWRWNVNIYMCVYIYTVNTCIECIHFFSSALSTTGSPKWGIQTLLARKTGKKCKFVYLCVCMLLCVFHTCPLPDSSVWAHYLAQLKNMKAKYRRHKKNSFLLFEQFLGEENTACQHCFCPPHFRSLFALQVTPTEATIKDPTDKPYFGPGFSVLRDYSLALF